MTPYVKSTSIMKNCICCSRWYHFFLLKKMRSPLVYMCHCLKIKVQCLQHNLMKSCLRKLLTDYRRSSKRICRQKVLEYIKKIALSEKRFKMTSRGQTDIYAEDNGVRKNPYKLYYQNISSKMFFLELSDNSFVLDDKHIDIALYYLRKKECYHLCTYLFHCTTTYILFDNYMLLMYKNFNKDASDEFWCGDNQLVLTPYVWGDNRRCGIAWTEVDKIFFPCRLPSEDSNDVTYFLLGVLDSNERKIDVYDSIYSEPYEQGIKHIEMYARMIPHLLKFSQFEKNHKSFGNAFNKFDIQWQRSSHQTGSTDCGAFLIKYVELLMMGKDVEKFLLRTYQTSEKNLQQIFGHMESGKEILVMIHHQKMSATTMIVKMKLLAQRNCKEIVNIN
nr:uncharacterized protein LOC104094789 [Nicotiana tomentosiformis]